MQVQVARATKDEYPKDAIDLYEREARTLIKHRGRAG